MRRKLSLIAGAVVMSCAVPACVLLASPSPAPPLVFPDGKRFAFSIVDDTDMATLERVRPVYEVLARNGLRTTKTVWVLESSDTRNSANQGATLLDPDYRAFVLNLQRQGFEIALHGVRGGGSKREDTRRGLEEFNRHLGAYPRMHINHSLNQDNLYWGRDSFSFTPFRWAGVLAIPHEFSGHDPQSPYFWGDLAQQHVQYVRRFTFPDINLRNVNPQFPYKLASTPYVNYWFPTSNGNRLIEFDELLKPENLDRLEREGGVSLVYAHLGSGSFNKDGGVNPRFEARIKDLARRKGWFAPASEILDHLRRQPAWTGQLTHVERLRLESHFLVRRILFGTH